MSNTTDVLKSAGNILASIAPTIATLFAGPLAGQGIAALEQALGLTPTGDKSAAAAALLTATPDQIIQLRKIDSDLKQKYIDAGIQIEQLDTQDRASARNMALTTKSYMPNVLTFMIAIGALGTAYMLFSGDIDGVKDPTTSLTMGTVIGYIFNELKTVMTFWFGSSRGSEQKNDMIQSALNSTPGTAGK